jgi:alpha-beta hydrolase superfamily lysophospholipase
MRLSGIYRSVEGIPKAGIVLAHGILVEKDYGGFYPALATALAKEGLESLRFDFRGHGESEGRLEEMTIAGEVQDLAMAVRVLKSRQAPQIGIVGTSFGAGVAVLYATQARRTPFALVLLSSILDFGRGFLEPETPWAKRWFTPSALAEAHARGTLDLAGRSLGIALVREFEDIHPAKVLRDLTTPVLMVHGAQDPIASFPAAHEAAQSSPGVEFVRVDGGEHYFEGSEVHVFRQVSEWLDAQVPA